MTVHLYLYTYHMRCVVHSCIFTTGTIKHYVYQLIRILTRGVRLSNTYNMPTICFCCILFSCRSAWAADGTVIFSRRNWPPKFFFHYNTNDIRYPDRRQYYHRVIYTVCCNNHTESSDWFRFPRLQCRAIVIFYSPVREQCLKMITV